MMWKSSRDVDTFTRHCMSWVLCGLFTESSENNLMAALQPLILLYWINIEPMFLHQSKIPWGTRTVKARHFLRRFQNSRILDVTQINQTQASHIRHEKNGAFCSSPSSLTTAEKNKTRTSDSKLQERPSGADWQQHKHGADMVGDLSVWSLETTWLAEQKQKRIKSMWNRLILVQLRLLIVRSLSRSSWQRIRTTSSTF